VWCVMWKKRKIKKKRNKTKRECSPSVFFPSLFYNFFFIEFKDLPFVVVWIHGKMVQLRVLERMP